MKVAALMNDKVLESISDVRDESDRDGMRIVIELKKNFEPQPVLNNLYVKTQLQTKFSGNMLAIVDGGRKPELMTLKSALAFFIKFRFVS